MRTPRRGDVAAHRVRRQEEHVAVATRREDDDVGEVSVDGAGDHVTRDDAARTIVLDDHLEHLVALVLLDGALRDLTLHGLVGADEQLLARLARGVERTRDLHATERTVVEVAAVLARERNTLGDALVDDVRADLGEAVDVGLAAAVVAALDRVVEEAVCGVTVVVVVLRGVDTALRGDRVRATGRVLVEERLDVVPGLTHRRGGRCAGETGADDDDLELATVRGVDELVVELVLRPHLRDVDVGSLGVLDRRALGEEGVGVVAPALLLGRGRRVAGAALRRFPHGSTHGVLSPVR